MNPQIILASASPRRAQLLDQIGIRYRVQTTEISEIPFAQEDPVTFVQRLAIEKAQALGDSYYPVLGADTIGVLNGNLLTKPCNFEHARQMLKSMSGKWHQILSAVAVCHRGNCHVVLNRNRVLFKTVTDEELAAYWKTGEPGDKAGAYAIQGMGAFFIEKIEGSYSGIMGLPLFETCQLLEQAGIKVLV